MGKICTSIEQSKKLVELGLDANTADMYWIKHWGKEIPRSIQEGYEGKILSKAWSLTALLGLIKDYTLQTTNQGKVFLVAELGDKPYHIATMEYDEPVDSCVEMIEKLHENNLI